MAWAAEKARTLVEDGRVLCYLHLDKVEVDVRALNPAGEVQGNSVGNLLVIQSAITRRIHKGNDRIGPRTGEGGGVRQQAKACALWRGWGWGGSPRGRRPVEFPMRRPNINIARYAQEVAGGGNKGDRQIGGNAGKWDVRGGASAVAPGRVEA